MLKISTVVISRQLCSVQERTSMADKILGKLFCIIQSSPNVHGINILHSIAPFIKNCGAENNVKIVQITSFKQCGGYGSIVYDDLHCHGFVL